MEEAGKGELVGLEAMSFSVPFFILFSLLPDSHDVSCCALPYPLYYDEQKLLEHESKQIVIPQCSGLLSL